MSARPIAFFATLIAAFFLVRACADGVARVDANQQAEAEQTQRDATPDMIPPLAVRPIEEAAIKKASSVDRNQFCEKLGQALRGKSAEFTRAMIQRAADEQLSILKFDQQHAIRNRQVAIGMTRCMALAAWGSPERNNSSVGSYGTHEQWVYPANYLYFENDVMTSYQSQN
jgi:hypothetical protein